MRARSLPTWLGSSLLLAALSSAVVAEGQPDDARRQALAQEYAVAQEHYLAKRYTEALPLFQEVSSGLDSPNAHLYVARCLRELGRPVEAHAAMRRTVAMAGARAHEEERFASTAEAAREELAALDRQLGRVSVRVDNPPPGLVIEVAGSALAPGALTEPIVVEPGPVQIDAIAPGRVLERQTITVAAGATEAVVLRYAEPLGAPLPASPTLTPPPAPVARPAPAEPPAARGWTHNGSIRVAGIVVASFGALGWATFAAAGVMANQRFSEVEERCNFERCTDPEVNDSIATGRILDYVANGGLGLGVLGTVAGGLMILFGGADEADDSVSGAVVPEGGFVSYRVRF